MPSLGRTLILLFPVVLFCFSSLCFCCTYPKKEKDGREEGTRGSREEKAKTKGKPKLSFIKKYRHWNQNNDQSQGGGVADCPESVVRVQQLPFLSAGGEPRPPRRPRQGRGSSKSSSSKPWKVDVSLSDVEPNKSSVLRAAAAASFSFLPSPPK